ncbi:DUF3954 domain-containing protein [Ureibacillus chungkukjangi]|uniref:DUF3954 domain-containing protein n=1 Tax=Ureibacillus chungkukjangi TaxID=1202712 RepID=UPI003850D487
MGKQLQELQELQELQDGLYIMKNGQLKMVQAPTTGFGKTTISWEANKPTRATHESNEKL